MRLKLRIYSSALWLPMVSRERTEEGGGERERESVCVCVREREEI